jgi:hypothetical protein
MEACRLSSCTVCSGECARLGHDRIDRILIIGARGSHEMSLAQGKGKMPIASRQFGRVVPYGAFQMETPGSIVGTDRATAAAVATAAAIARILPEMMPC